MLNRLVRTRMPGGVGGGIREDSPYPDWPVVESAFNGRTQILTGSVKDLHTFSNFGSDILGP